MSKLIPWWAISWMLAGAAIIYQMIQYESCALCGVIPEPGFEPWRADPYPALTSILTLFAPPAGGEVFPAMLPPFALALLAVLVVKRFRAKRTPVPEDGDEQLDP